MGYSGYRGIVALGVTTLLVVFPGSRATAEGLEMGSERQARRNLAEKLLRLSRSLDMKEASFPESAGGGGQNFDRNSGNSFTSNTTYHSTVWSRCLEWVGGQFCNRWLDPYISMHGFGGDKSPLEGVVAQAWAQRKTDQEADGPIYTIWEVDRVDGGTNLDDQGKFDTRGLADWRILPEVRQQIEKVGAETAIRQISATYDQNTGPGANTMPNMEALRLMASRWTKMFRNRMVTNLGESRAFAPGAEVALSEETPTCDDYATAVENDLDVTGIQERIQPQPVLQPESQANSIQRRVAMCKALRAQSIFAINPVVTDKGVGQGNPNEEAIDQWKSRLNIAAIDFAGVDIGQLPRPEFGRIRQEDITTKLQEYNAGGLSYRTVVRSNRQQIESYNNQLKSAAVGMKEVAARAPFIRDNSEKILEYQIRPGSMSAVRINDLTPEMRAELSGTGFPRTTRGDPQDPTLNLEQTPSTITVRTVGGQ